MVTTPTRAAGRGRPFAPGAGHHASCTPVYGAGPRRWPAWIAKRFRAAGAMRTESVCGTIKRSYGLRRLCWLGLAKADLQVRLATMVYNLRRSWRLLE